MKRLVLVNPNTNVAATSLMVAIARQHLRAGFALEGVTATSGAALITDADQLRVAANAVVAIGPTLAGRSDGVIVSAFGDPGVETLRRHLLVPVAGIGESALREAAAGGRRYSIVTTTPALVGSISAHAARLGLDRHLVSIRTTEGALEMLMADPALLAAALERAAIAAIDEDGAEAIIVGGGPLAAAAKMLRERLAIGVIEPIPAAVRWMHAQLPAS
jgi:allantoin racemase